MATPPAPAPGAEVDTFAITDLQIDGNGAVDVDLNQFADKNNPNDVTITNTSTTPITLIEVRNLGGNDGQQDVVRIDLSQFDEDFDIVLKNTGTTVEDFLFLEGVHEATDNGDGTWSVSYYGSDAELHTVTVTPENATIDLYYAPDGIVSGGAGADIMGDGYADIQGDEIGSGDSDPNDVIHGNAGSDTIYAGDGADTIYGDYSQITGSLSTALPDNTFTGSPAGPAPGAEIDTFAIDDLLIDNNGHVAVQVDQFADKTLANDITIQHGGTEAITRIVVEKFGGADGQADVIRFDLSTYNDDFLVEIKDEDSFDTVIFEGVQTVTDNGDGTWDLTYIGTDSTLQSVTVLPDTASVEFYLADTSPYFFDDTIDAGDGDDVVDGGFGDDSILGGLGNDTIDGGDGSDTLDGGAGDDVIVGDRTAHPLGLADTMTYSYAQDIDGNQATHFGEEGTGAADDPLLLIDGDIDTEVRYHADDIVEYDFGQVVTAGTSITLSEGAGAEDGIINVYVSYGSTDPNGDTLSASGGGVGYENAVTNGQSVLIYSGPSDSTIDLIVPIDATHIQFVTQESHAGWAELEFTDMVNLPDPGDDVITGGDGNDLIDAGAGNDSIDGGGDDDTIIAGLGDDTIAGGAGIDTYDANAATDLADESITVVVDGNGDGTSTKSGDATTDTLTSVERIIAAEAAAENDEITITDGVLKGDVSNISDSAVGFFTSTVTGASYFFGGPGEPTINEILSGSFDPGTGPIWPTGTYTITGGEEDGATIGNTYFENFETANFEVVCFVRGARILTDRGEVGIEDLAPGDLVETMDHGLQPIRWIGSTTVPATGDVAPVRISKGTLGATRDLWVSPQHRILLTGWKAEMYFGEPEVLAAAKSLVNDTTIRVCAGGTVQYFHMLFDNHEIVFSNGVPSESLHPGHVALNAIGSAARDEVISLFPELAAPESIHGKLARPALRGFEGSLLRAV